MKKLDKLVLNAFIGPFFLTFLVVVFILLNIQMLRYFDDIIGKGLAWLDIGKLLFYFAIFTTPTAFPLAILLSSLIAFGNLGEHFELTAIKSAGISLVRALQPIFLFVLILTVIAFYTNNNLVPRAALEAYSLIYDIKQKKPALDLREGTFYNGIPDVSIKVDKKYPNDEAALGDIVVYDHRKHDGNKEVTKADSGRMYTILNERYLKFELFNGYNYREGATEENAMTGRKSKKETLTRIKFDKTEVVFDLSSFDMKRTEKDWFKGNRIMRNLAQLDDDIDSLENDVLEQQLNYYLGKNVFFYLFRKKEPQVLKPELEKFKNQRDSLDRARLLPDSSTAQVKVSTQAVTLPKRTFWKTRLSNIPQPDSVQKDTTIRKDSASIAKAVKAIDSLYQASPNKIVVQNATNLARQAKTQIENTNSGVETYIKELRTFEIQWHKIIANSIACIAMFLIGAPLGAIIKKGGLGVPFLVSILFFIIYYVLTMQGEKLAKQNLISSFTGIWAADFILVFVGLFFLRQARKDARLFEADFYAVIYTRIKTWWERRKSLQKASIS